MNASLTPQANAEPQMDTASLKKFAQSARRQLIETVSSKLDRVLTEGSLARRESSAAITKLEDQIAKSSPEQVIEQVAYTWFNRFCALRFMDVNGYTRIGIVSPPEGFVQPEILSDAKQGLIDDQWKVDREQVNGLLDQTVASTSPEQEAYQALLVAACNHYHTTLPFLFEEIIDYTELLIPDDLLSDESILERTRQALTPTACQNVEVIGWLYQFYISEKKDDVFAALKKGKKITPENIPAATQLFTPHWIVRYLVENSLGRLWMLNHPDSRLPEQMDYYIKPEEPETDFLQISSPEELKICDPACGSGHMLTYAFDLLYAIYEEQGYPSTDIPRLILTHNLYGIEIDQRAGALAAFALTMKAREKYRRFLTGGKVVQPNICVLENISIDPEDLSAYMDKVGRDLFSGGLQGVVNQWEEADNFGSLIRPLVTDVSEVLELLRERQMGEDLFLAGVHQKVLKALRQADYLSPKYHVVVANPPYMGGRNMNPSLKRFLTADYADVKSDTFSAFIARNKDLSVAGGQLGFMTPFVWMFISAYEGLRLFIIDTMNITSLVQLEYSGFEGATVPICTFTLENSKPSNRKGAYVRLTDFKGSSNQGPKTIEAINNPDCGWFFRATADNYRKIPNTPIAYWISDRLVEVFSNPMVSEYSVAESSQCLTGDNDRFLRFVWEIDHDNVGIDRKWLFYAKGGGYRKWHGNLTNVINWNEEAINHYRTSKVPRIIPEYLWYKQGITWGFITSSLPSFRHLPEAAVFDVGGSSIFFEDDSDVNFFLGLFNTDLALKIVGVYNQTLNYQLKDIRNIPTLGRDKANKTAINGLVEQCRTLSEHDWNSFETAFTFVGNPLIDESAKETSVESAYSAQREIWRTNTTELSNIERELNERFVQLYELEEEIEIKTQNRYLSLECNPYYRYDSDKSESELESLLLADTMREFISYAVGCMLGRYSLDKPGLILANQGETADDYRQQIPEPTFAPDEDNVIPLLDGDWFTDDISERFKEFLKVTFGTEHYEENLTFLENSLYPDNLTGKKRKTIRDYFLKGFYNHHIKLYKKRPIYWLFSSPKGTFNALIYMHRYRPDTVSVVLNDYLREFQAKLKSKVDSLQHLSDQGGTDKAKKASALKEISKLKKQLTELEDYERDVLFPLAQQQIEIDLDDGVLTNYNKFGTALKKVTGLTGKNKK